MVGANGHEIDERVAIVGAGPAGLAAAWCLRHKGIDPLVIERGPSVASSWRSRHDHLHLNTHRGLSHQPGRRMSRSLGPFPSRDDYVNYLEDYATGMRLRFGTEVLKVDRVADRWQLKTSAGILRTDHLVIATGPDIEPVVPRLEGDDTFPGVLIHAGRFHNVADYKGKDVLIIGPGNSGVDLLNHLLRSDVGDLWLSARSGMNIFPLRVAGVPTHYLSVSGRHLPIRVQDLNGRLLQRALYGDLTRYGYPRAELGVFSKIRRDCVTAAADDGFVKALKAGRVQMKPALERFEGPRARFVDGSAIQPDCVILATGYRPGLESIVGHLVELDRFGVPSFTGTQSSAIHPGLWFFGLDRSVYGNMYIRRRQARQLADLIADTAVTTHRGSPI